MTTEGKPMETRRGGMGDELAARVFVKEEHQGPRYESNTITTVWLRLGKRTRASFVGKFVFPVDRGYACGGCSRTRVSSFHRSKFSYKRHPPAPVCKVSFFFFFMIRAGLNFN